MFRTLALGVAVAALSLPAFAATAVKVDVSGLDTKATHTAIVRAAKEACRTEFRNASTFEQHYLWSDCLNTAVTHAEQTLAANTVGKTTVAGR